MQSQVVTKVIEMPDGRQITIETGKLARQADGAVVVRMGNTMVLATVVSLKNAKEDAGFFPLSVDYQEKYASTGRIPGGFLKRESRLSDHEILISRLVDRAIRPLFADDYMSETQISVTFCCNCCFRHPFWRTYFRGARHQTWRRIYHQSHKRANRESRYGFDCCRLHRQYLNGRR
jgi:3' exoribonuclease family, domain 1